MKIRDLDLKTRNKIYSHTKSILRKYQKGIVTGKLTADKFAQNILCDDYINHLLSEDLLHEEDFKSSYCFGVSVFLYTLGCSCWLALFCCS